MVEERCGGPALRMTEGWPRGKGLVLALAAAAAHASSGGLRDYVGRNIAHTQRRVHLGQHGCLIHLRDPWLASQLCTGTGAWTPQPQTTLSSSCCWGVMTRCQVSAGRIASAEVSLGGQAADGVRVPSSHHEALNELPPEEKDYWVPRLHFSTATMSELRAQGHWIPQYVDAWSEVRPSVAARYTKGENSHSWG